MRVRASIADPALGKTKARLLDAAFHRLAAEGYHALSLREIAREAGVNHALINYHFRSKDQLVIAVLDEANRRLLERQQRMYRSSATSADKWAQACRFYEDDLASGFVRVQAELMAASMGNAALREQFLPRVMAWKALITTAVREAFDAYNVKLPPYLTPEVIGCWVSEFWLGMEIAMLIDDGKYAALHRAALGAMQHLLDDLDRFAVARPGARAAVKPRPRRGRSPRH